MNLGGIKVSAVELEQAMNTCEHVAETAAIAVTREGGGPSDLVVFAVLPPGAHPDHAVLRAELQGRIRDVLNPLFRIADLRTIDSLPRTASNKVMRRVLRDRYQRD
jgi:acetyl-CoA synthetase